MTLEDIVGLKHQNRSRRSSSRTSSLSSGSVLGKKKKTKKVSHVLHFLLNLIEDKSLESVVQWVDEKEGTFKITNANEVVEIWNRSRNKSVKDWNNFA